MKSTSGITPTKQTPLLDGNTFPIVPRLRTIPRQCVCVRHYAYENGFRKTAKTLRKTLAQKNKQKIS